MSMRVAVVDYGGGNIASARRALEEAASRRGLAAEILPVRDPEALRRADRIVLPGQGAFADCLRGLEAAGLREALEDGVRAGKPFLGICVGMQVMAARGLEHGDTPGLGWIAGEIASMRPAGSAGDPPMRLPHMGWNTLDFTPGHPLLEGIAPGAHAYFVHSYALEDGAAGDILATTDYAGPRVAMVARGNRAGTQFHVEKSQALGLGILGNFLAWRP